MKFSDVVHSLQEGQIAKGQGSYGHSSGYSFHIIKAYGALRYYDDHRNGEVGELVQLSKSVLEAYYHILK